MMRMMKLTAIPLPEKCILRRSDTLTSHTENLFSNAHSKCLQIMSRHAN